MDITDGIREFMNRDWAALAAHKMAVRADQHRRMGWHATWDASQALSDYIRDVHPQHLRPTDRDEDWEAHQALKARLERSAHAFASR